MKELWLQNQNNVDVSLSDLGVKVGANKTIEVFAYNPYLTEDQVTKSLNSGSISKRLKSGALKKVAGKPSDKEHGVGVLESVTRPTNNVRVRSSVIVEPKQEEDLIVEDLMDIADYGLDGLEENVNMVKNPNGAVTVEQKTEEVPVEEKLVKPDLKIEKLQNTSTQSIYVTVNDSVEQENALPTHIVEPPKEAITQPPEDKPVVKEEPKVIATEESVAVEPPKNKEEKPVDAGEKKEGMRIATKTKSGITVMKVKE